MLVVTTPALEGRRVVRYLGIVSGFREFFAGIRDIVGGRSAASEQELRKAKTIAPGMLMVSASGTAVVLE